MTNPLKKLEDSIRKGASSFEDNIRKGASSFEDNTKDNFQNYLEWVTSKDNPLSGLVKDVSNVAAFGLGDEILAAATGKKEPSTAAAILSQAPAVPTLEEARTKVATAVDLKRRRGRAASILSDRPDNPLGYTGGGMLATRVLGGA